MIRRFVIAGLLACLPLPVSADEDAAQLAGQARAVLRHHCYRCHSGEGSEGGDFDVLDAAGLVEAGYVIAGDPDASYLFERVIRDQMPPRNVPERVLLAEGQIIRNWIAAGAAPFPQAEGRPPLALADVLATVRNHLRDADRDQRRHLRFFTLHHLYNNPKVLEEDLRVYRAALSKALNSLSWKPRIVLPRAVDAAQVVFAIDVRDLEWDRGELWQELVRAYPYGLKYRHHRDERLRRIDEDLCDLSGCDLPVLRADWFVATATRPPLYHKLLELPDDAGELERKLGVDVRANFLNPAPERIARGGFARSGVSGQNRLVERHEALYGAYWKSYDFLPGAPRSKLTRFPLGPQNLFPKGQHPWPQQAFAHDGGEIIFHLPNGLQGYLLVDGEDRRIDDGPIQVVGDALKTSGTPVIVNGVSCMACHRHGMIPFKDLLREGSAVFGEAERYVQRLYPDEPTMNALLARDSERFLAALEKAVGPFLRVGPDADKPVREFIEPVGEVARLHRLVFLDLQTIACELDIDDPREIPQRVGERRLKQLGLESLLEQGGVVSRLEWEAVDGLSLMQELARELRYTPYRAH